MGNLTKAAATVLLLCNAGCRTLQTVETKVTLDIGINERHEKDRVTISIGGKY